jgi:hypothetical protein
MTRTNIPNYYNVEKITQNAHVALLQETKTQLDKYFQQKTFSVKDIYAMYDLLIKYKRLTNSEYKIEKEENTIV